MTPIKRAAKLVMGYDLERLDRLIYGKKTISTRLIIKEIEILEDRLREHGIAHRDLYSQLQIEKASRG